MARPTRKPDALHRMRVAESLQRGAEAPDAPPTAGRKLGRSAPPAQAPTPTQPSTPTAVGGMLPAGPGLQTPFAAAQVDMGTNVAPSEANSTRVLGIVMALVFATGLAAFAAALVLLMTFFLWNQRRTDGSKQEDDGVVHERDSGIVEDPDLQAVIARQRARRQAAEANEVRDPMAEMFGGLGAGPVTVYTKGPGRENYRQIEILCNQVGFRQRARLINDRAHIPIVPAARCRLVFQGNVPVKSWVTGGDTVTCTFNPIVCR